MVMTVYFHRRLETSTIFTHFAYLPIVLACAWWGKRAILLALLLAGILIFLRTPASDNFAIWEDLFRSSFFLMVAVMVSTLREQGRKAAQAMRASEEKYRNVVEKSLTAIFLYRDERVLFANQRLSELLLVPMEHIVGHSVWEFFHEDDLPRVRHLVQQRQNDSTSDLHYEARLLKGNGSILWAEILSSIIQVEGTQAVLVNIYDVTERRDAESKRKELLELTRKQEEQLVHSASLAEMGEMAAAVAHELNQPLTGIRNFARNAFYMIENNVGTNQDVQENLRLISQQVDRAAKIINQMRELTRKSDLKFKPLNMNQLVEDTLEFLSPQFRMNNVSVTPCLNEQPLEIMGDATRLEQVLLNLMTNANQAMEGSKTKRVHVTTRMESGAILPVVVEIQDTGHGFEASDTEKLFAPFYSTKEAGRGTGLGLSISLRIIHQHNGTIEAFSEPGQGASFVIRLPVAPEELQERFSSDSAEEVRHETNTS